MTKIFLSDRMTKNNLSKGAMVKNCVGQVARGDDFWDRVNELDLIWDAVEAGSHILLAAPRRVGKTSIMYHMLDRPKEGYIVAYVDTESADSENEFWHKLYSALNDEVLISRLKRYSLPLGDTFKRVFGSIKKVGPSGVEFGDGIVKDYGEAFEKLIDALEIDARLIIMVDEFAQTVENLIKYEDVTSAERFLKTTRTLRQNGAIAKKVTFVYAGSIGLESVVAKINATKSINDLNSIKILPLGFKDAEAFADELARDSGLNISKAAITYLLKQIEWLIPFYIQLLLQELKSLSRIKGLSEVTSAHVDEAVNAAIEHRNHFDHWRTKLKEAFDNRGYLFAKEVLSELSQQHTITSAQISNYATKHEVDADDAKEVIHMLVYDGYFNNNDDAKRYRFNSPILRMWWYKYVAN